MDLLGDPLAAAAGGGDGRRRRMCTTGCGRPISVCLCGTLPSAPLPTATQIVILHPHERHHKLATVPILAKCLRDCEVIVGRKLKYGKSRLLDSLHDQASENPNLPVPRAVYLFPGPDALPFGEVSQMYSSLDDLSREGVVLTSDRF